MAEQQRPNRRAFFRQSALGAVTAGVAAGSVDAVADDPSTPSKRKSDIRIGARFNEHRLKSRNDDDLRFFKQIGVDYVDIELKLIVRIHWALHLFAGRVEGVYRAVGCRRFEDRACQLIGAFCLNAHLGRDAGQREIGKARNEPHQFRSYPHGIWGDSHGDLYVSEVGSAGQLKKFVRC